MTKIEIVSSSQVLSQDSITCPDSLLTIEEPQTNETRETHVSCQLDKITLNPKNISFIRDDTHTRITKLTPSKDYAKRLFAEQLELKKQGDKKTAFFTTVDVCMCLFCVIIVVNLLF